MRRVAFGVAFASASWSTPAWAEDDDESLKREVEDLRARVRAMEQAQDARAEEAAAEEAEVTMPLDLETHLQGWGAASLDVGSGVPLGFALDEFVFRYSANLDRRYSLSAEIAFEAGNEGLVVDLETLELNLAFFPVVGLRVGRVHAPWTYWANTALHGSYRFLPVAVPEVIKVEDKGGGVMPVHQVGAWLAGAIPVGLWRVTYQAGVSNGRSTYIGQVMQGGDSGWGKAYNGHVWFESPGGLLAGVGGYHDVIEPSENDPSFTNVTESVQEDIVGVQLSWIGPRVEVASEAYLISHARLGEEGHLSAGGYALLGVTLGKTTPYILADVLEIDQASPYYTLTDELSSSRKGAVGLRYDLGLRAVVKLQGEVVQAEVVGAPEESTVGWGAHLQLAAGF